MRKGRGGGGLGGKKAGGKKMPCILSLSSQLNKTSGPGRFQREKKGINRNGGRKEFQLKADFSLLPILTKQVRFEEKRGKKKKELGGKAVRSETMESTFSSLFLYITIKSYSSQNNDTVEKGGRGGGNSIKRGGGEKDGERFA